MSGIDKPRTLAATPLEAHDAQRARALKAKIRERVSDVRRHFVALRAAMAEFGDDFELEAFRRAYHSDNPVELNKVKAMERGVDQLYNYIAELAAFGLELAEVRARGDETNARRDFEALSENRILPRELVRRLQRLRELRRQLVHEYAAATANQVHEAAELVSDVFPRFYDRYREWVRQGFAAPLSVSAGKVGSPAPLPHEVTLKSRHWLATAGPTR